MSFTPVIPVSGLAGWRFLQRTYDSQNAAFQKSPRLTSDTEYFTENIAKVTTAEELVSDRRLLRVALGAFGLQDDLDNRFFVRKVLEGGTAAPDSLANKLADDRYKKMTDAFGFGPDKMAQTWRSSFAQDIVSRYRAQEFELAIGDQNEDMRLGLNALRTLPDIVSADISEDAKWFRIMGNPPLRRVFETALGLPGSFAKIELDQQLGVFKDKLSQKFGGDLSQFTEDGAREELVQKFLVLSQVQQVSRAQPGSVALTLLQSAPVLYPGT